MKVGGTEANAGVRVHTTSLCLAALILLSAGAFAQQANPSDAQKAPRKKLTVEEVRSHFWNSPNLRHHASPRIQGPHAAEAMTSPVLAQLQSQKAAADVGPGHTMGAAGGSGNSSDPAGGSSTSPGGCDPAGTPSTPGGSVSHKQKGKDEDHHPSGGSNPPGTAGPPCGNNPPAGSKNHSGGNPTGSSNPAGTAGANPTGSTPSAGTPGGNPSASNPPAGTPGGKPTGGGTTPSAAGPSHPHSVVAASVIAPAALQTPPPPAQSGSNTSKLGAKVTSNVICPPGPGPAVFNVNGKNPAAIIFTQDPAGNDYAIHGCRFGYNRGTAHLEGGFKSGNVSLKILAWDDYYIRAQVDPNLVGEIDENTVSLVITTHDGNSSKFPGSKFYAERVKTHLESFPQFAVTLGATNDAEGKPVAAKYSSPYKPNFPNATPLTGGVDRNDVIRFNPGTDIWDLSGLSPQFTPIDFYVDHWALDQCTASGLGEGESTIYNDGHWSGHWENNRIVVNFAEQHCHMSGGLMGIGDDESNSSYALIITVLGPKGVDPWAK